jgi:hypothetical protein
MSNALKTISTEGLSRLKMVNNPPDVSESAVLITLLAFDVFPSADFK